jgi:hypothetical protein
MGNHSLHIMMEVGKMKATHKVALYRLLNARNARVLYLVPVLIALVLGAGAPDAVGVGGGGAGG